MVGLHGLQMLVDFSGGASLPCDLDLCFQHYDIPLSFEQAKSFYKKEQQYKWT